MTITTKAALADELSISRARVSQYVKAGLPVRPDGKLNRDEALNWLKLNTVGLNTFEDRGANRAARLAAGKPAPRKAAPAAPPPPAEDWSDEVVPMTFLADLIGRSGGFAAEAAVQAGATMEVAYAIDQAVCVQLWHLAESLLGVSAGGITPFERMVDRRIVEPDWPTLADAAGEPVDLDAWAAFADRLPVSNPKLPEAPQC